MGVGKGGLAPLQLLTSSAQQRSATARKAFVRARGERAFLGLGARSPRLCSSRFPREASNSACRRSHAPGRYPDALLLRFPVSVFSSLASKSSRRHLAVR